MTLQEYKKSYLNYCEKKNCLADKNFTLTDAEIEVVEKAFIVWSVIKEESEHDGMLKILDHDGETLFSYKNTWDDSYRPYIVNAIEATKTEEDGHWRELEVDGIEGHAIFYKQGEMQQ